MRWKYALAQHPMYLLIREDTQCAERTPPWGAPTIEEYIDRVRRNLQLIESFPEVRLGFEWSGYELELLQQDAPDVMAEMYKLAKERRTAFYNGTYAQPHLQMLSSEANYRQFEYGTRVYRDLCGMEVRTYAHQEASVHDQVPQLLAAFGIRFAVVPTFSSTLAWLDEGELVLFGGKGPRFVQGHEFVAWRGLDGTEVPLYLRAIGSIGERTGSLEELIANEAIAGLQHIPPIIVRGPDLIEIDDRWVEEHRKVDLVLLDEALEGRLQKCPPRSHVRYYSNWSYIEGIRAEELSRANWVAETYLLRGESLNALVFALTGREPDSFDNEWKTVLGMQHHDVYCFCAPELKGKAIGRLQSVAREVAEKTREAVRTLICRLDCRGPSDTALVVLNPSPHVLKNVVTIDGQQGNPRVMTRNGEIVPSEWLPNADGTSRLRFVGKTSGLGYMTYWVADGGAQPEETECSESVTFENEFYRAIVNPDATFTALLAKPSSKELLSRTELRGNQLAATDSTGLSPRREGIASPQEWKKEQWQPPRRGPELRWESTSPTRLRRSSLGTTVLASGRLNPRITADAEIRLYDSLPWIDINWTFGFDKACVGTFYDDYSKLRVQWPLCFTGDIHHDIAFGVVETRDERPFFPASWVDVSDGTRGLAYFHKGTPKHWVSDNTLINLFGWGEYTQAIGSRLWRWNWNKAFDQRLRGEHVIHTAVYPHTGDWRSADVSGAARGFGAEPLALSEKSHGGNLPDTETLLRFRDREIVATCVQAKKSALTCRVYPTCQEARQVNAHLRHLRVRGLYSLTGEAVSSLRPFQIGTLLCERDL